MNMMTTVALPPLPSPNLEAMRRALLGATTLAAHDRSLRLRKLFAAFDRDDMETAVDLLLDEMDRMDGDPDKEPSAWVENNGAGITAFDYSLGEDAEPEGDGSDVAWTEWHGRRGPAVRSIYERTGAPCAEEDEEEDDSCEANGDELDGSLGEDDFATPSFFGDGQPGCPISDPGGCQDDREPNTWPERGEDRQFSNMMAGAADGHVDDDEEEVDRCLAGDDMVSAGPVVERGRWLTREAQNGWDIGNEDDGERSRQTAQTPTAANEGQV